jgi:dTDP-4-dehydrorhamnose reductase
MLDDLPETTPVKSSEYPQVAQRPAYSVLDTAAIRSVFGIKPAALNESLTLCLQELQDYE